MTEPDSDPDATGAAHDAAVLARADAWFLSRGLSYFVAAERDAARAALSPRRTLPLLVAVVLVGGGAGFALAHLAGERSVAPAVGVSVAVFAGLYYALTAVRARPVVAWALQRTFSSLRLIVPMASRALPLLLVFVTFLFINAEVWEMTANLPTGALWLSAVLLTGFAIVFLLVRLPDEVDGADDAVDDAFLIRSCRAGPLESAARELVTDPAADPAAYATLRGFERWNLILVLLVVQVAQVVLLVAAVFVLLVLFGSLVMVPAVQANWTGLEPTDIANIGDLNISFQLAKVSLFLAAFSGLYFTVSAVTDDTYRSQFFDAVTEELERAVGSRAVYLCLRARLDPADSTGSGSVDGAG